MSVPRDWTLPHALHTGIAQSYVRHSTGDDPYAIYLKKGRSWLRTAEIFGIKGDDVPFLIYLLWSGCSKEWERSESGDDFYLVAGEISDQVSDDEADLLVEIEPTLGARVPQEGVGNMSPNVTALHELLLEVAGTMEDRWVERAEESA